MEKGLNELLWISIIKGTGLLLRGDVFFQFCLIKYPCSLYYSVKDKSIQCGGLAWLKSIFLMLDMEIAQ